MSKVRVLFLGTPEFARYHLETLVADEHFAVVGVVTQPDRPSGRKMKLQSSPVKQWATQQGLEVFTPETLKSDEAFERLQDFNAEAAVVVAYGQILPKRVLALFPNKIVNVHGSLLPLWRGAAPIQRAIMAGDKETGVSLQVMVSKLDAGPVLGVRKIPIDDEITALEMLDRMQALGADLLHVEFMDYLRGHLTPKPQDESLVTLAPKLEKSEGRIDWRQPAQKIHDLVRGLTMGPGAHALKSGKKIKVHRTEVMPGRGKPGEILAAEPQRLIVACKEKALSLIEVQPESKARQSVDDYLKGYHPQVGEFFE